MILVDVGEIGVHVDGDVHLLKPTLYAMSRLGAPQEIVEIYAVVMSEALTKKARQDQFLWALAVVNACAEDDLDEVFGYINERLRFVVKRVPPGHILPLARALLRHGITGVVPEEKNKRSQKKDYTNKFVASECVSLAVAHLGVSEREAWAMTMTSLVGALRAKFPDTKEQAGEKAPSAEEHDATMEWFDRVEAKRKKRNA